jgi:Protein of unknown function (DUF1553)
VPLAAKDADQWRSVLLFVDRYDQPTVPAMFDFANPDSHSPQRFQTTVPQQALFLMNSPFMKEQSDALARCVPKVGSEPDSKSVRALYERVLLREPSVAEEELAGRFFADAEALQEQVPFVWSYGTQEVEMNQDGEVRIGPFAKFGSLSQKDSRWAHTEKIPDPKWGYAFWAKQSGHTGNGSVATAARWKAPRAMTLRVVGQVKKPSDKGNGVRVFVLSESRGLLKDLLIEPAQSGEVVVSEVKLAKGESLTFAVGSEGDTNSDSFEWRLSLYEKDRLVSDARRDFCGLGDWPLNRSKAQTPLAQLAQVLMMANEFQFID